MGNMHIITASFPLYGLNLNHWFLSITFLLTLKICTILIPINACCASSMIGSEMKYPQFKIVRGSSNNLVHKRPLGVLWLNLLLTNSLRRSGTCPEKPRISQKMKIHNFSGWPVPCYFPCVYWISFSISEKAHPLHC